METRAFDAWERQPVDLRAKVFRLRIGARRRKAMAACCVWDFTLRRESATQKLIEERLEGCAKKWAFQLERGETGYEHWQGRFSLKVKQRLHGAKRELGFDDAHLSPTSNENHGNFFYVMKEETRLEGPWSDEEPAKFIPWDVQLMEALHPWQAEVVDWAKQRELRKIHVILNPAGGAGKTSLCRYMLVHGLGRVLPFCNDYRDLLRMVCDMPEAPVYLIDMPRAVTKDKLYQLWGAVETIKGGYAYDDRYKFRERIMDPPQVVVFSNEEPDKSLLSSDRWDIRRIVNNRLSVEGAWDAVALLDLLLEDPSIGI